MSRIFAKNSLKYHIFLLCGKIDADDAETHFLAHYRLFWRLYATGITRIQSVVLRRIGGPGHIRSRDKDGGHTTRSSMANKPMLYANFTTLYFTGVIAD